MFSGVFYTKKSNTKYNFNSSVGAFPPLPPHLHLDRADNMEEIKLFVQNQARGAARRMGNIAMGTTTTRPPTPDGDQDRSATNQLTIDASPSTDANNLMHEPTSSESCVTGADDSLTSALCMNYSSSEPLVEIDSQFHIPMDLDYLGQCLEEEVTAEEIAKNMFLDYPNYFDQQAAAPEQPLSEAEEDEQFTMTS